MFQSFIPTPHKTYAFPLQRPNPSWNLKKYIAGSLKNTECVNAEFSMLKLVLQNRWSTRSANCFTDHLLQNIQPQITCGSNTVKTNEAIEAGGSSFYSTTDTKREKSSFTCILRIINMNVFFFYFPVPWVSCKQKRITFLSLF